MTREALIEVIREILWRQNFAAHEDAETIQRQKSVWVHEWERMLAKAADVLLRIEDAGVRLVPKEQSAESVVAVARAMRDAYGKHECIPWEQSKTRAAWKVCARFGYTAMLSASPFAPKEPT